MPTYQDNATRKAVPTDVGIKISKPGYPADRSAGNNLVFSSSWPSLPIAFETTIDKPVGNLSVAHGLKFPPLCMVWASGNDPGGTTAASFRYFMPVDATNVYIRQNGFDDYMSLFWSNATKLNIKCFNLDLTQDIDYILAPGDSFNMAYDPNFGIKVVKPNKDINSRDLRDFTVHSRAQSPLILAVKTQATVPAANVGTGIGSVVQYTNRTKNPVWVYGFIKIGSTIATGYGIPVNSYIPAPYSSQAYPRTITDGFTSYIGYNDSGVNADNGASLVILRDPMFAPNPVTVQY